MFAGSVKQLTLIIVPQCAVSLGGSLWDPCAEMVGAAPLQNSREMASQAAAKYTDAYIDGGREISWWLASGNCARTDKLELGSKRFGLPLSGLRCSWRSPWGVGAVIGRYFGRMPGATRRGACDDGALDQ